MMLRNVQKNYLLILFPLIFLQCSSETEKIDSEKPNIIFILADDLGYGDLGCYNQNSRIPTPYLDQLAAQSMRFTDAHAPAAVCTPTRYGILTGRYCWRSRLPVGVLRGYGRALIEENRKTVASMLKDHGYETGVVGKWHLGLDWVIKPEYQDSLAGENIQMNDVGMVTEVNPDFIDFSKNPTDGPLHHGFSYSYILPASLDMEPYCYLENDQLEEIPNDYTLGNDLNTGYTGAFWRPGRMAPGFKFDQVLPRFTRKAEEFIKHSNRQNPFFLYLAFPSPHTPWVPTAAFQDKTEVGAYGDYTAMVDAMVGKVLHALDSLQLSDNTLLFFTSDNGPFWTPELIEKYNHRAAGSWRGMKADAWEGGHRVPLMVRWPGKIAAGSRHGTPVSLTSFMATCADILGIDLDDHSAEDSYSIWSLLNGSRAESESEQAIIQHSSKNYFVVRKNNWKYINGLGSGGFSEPSIIEPGADDIKGQLYNLDTDPEEQHNLFSEMPEKVAELSGILEQYKSQGHSRIL